LARGSGVAGSAGVADGRGPSSRQQCAAAVGPPRRPAVCRSGYRHPGRIGSAEVGRTGPGRADAAERGEAAGPGRAHALRGCESGGGAEPQAGGGGLEGGAARPGSRLTRAAAAADSHGPQQRRGRRGGERRRGGTRRGSKGGGSAAPFQLFPQRRHPDRGYDSEGSAGAGLEPVVYQAAHQAATNMPARRQVKSHGEKVLLTLKEIQLSERHPFNSVEFLV
jgi:hypothetical protein